MTPCMPRGSTNGILKDAIDGQAIAAIPAFDRSGGLAAIDSGVRLLLNASIMATTDEEPAWLKRMREASQQRPRTRNRKVAWSDLQRLLRERDVLWHQASSESRGLVEAIRNSESADKRPE
jgi:hypothetical protein